MSKERLEEIERYHSNKKDVMWAVRQIKLLQAENETLSSANQDLLHEVRVLKNKAESLEHDFMYYFKLANKLDHQNKRYRERIEEIEAKNWEFIVQNKRYREALEFYAMSGQAIGETKHGEVARKALEGESNE